VGQRSRDEAEQQDESDVFHDSGRDGGGEDGGVVAANSNGSISRR
jgi:hypothetical protein